jgi:hypothetical protein
VRSETEIIVANATGTVQAAGSAERAPHHPFGSAPSIVATIAPDASPPPIMRPAILRSASGAATRSRGGGQERRDRTCVDKAGEQASIDTKPRLAYRAPGNATRRRRGI